MGDHEPLSPRQSARPSPGLLRALDVLADPWSFLILREGFFGVHRFGVLQRNLGISRKALAARLSGLVAEEILVKKAYSEHPPRFEYRHTPAGRDFYAAVLMLMDWGDRHLSESDPPPLTLIHKTCGRRLHPVVVCGNCARPIAANDVETAANAPPIAEISPGPATRRTRDEGLFTRGRPCSVARTLAVMGDRWSFRILREVFAGTRRFDDFHRTIGVARNILAERLILLLEAGLLAQRKYQDRPPRFDYILTPAGADLYPALIMLMKWGETWRPLPMEQPSALLHRPCGARLAPRAICIGCRHDITATEVEYTMNYSFDPGAPSADEP